MTDRTNCKFSVADKVNVGIIKWASFSENESPNKYGVVTESGAEFIFTEDLLRLVSEPVWSLTPVEDVRDGELIKLSKIGSVLEAKISDKVAWLEVKCDIGMQPVLTANVYTAAYVEEEPIRKISDIPDGRPFTVTGYLETFIFFNGKCKVLNSATTPKVGDAPHPGFTMMPEDWG